MQRKQVWEHFIGTILVGVFAGFLVVSDLNYSLRASIGEAVVVTSGYHYRGGVTIAEAVHGVDGKLVRGTLRAWYVSLKKGQGVRVRYLPNEPGELVLDRFWQLHFAPVLGIVILGITVFWESSEFAALGRRNGSGLGG
ncbi:hypothetical protein SAMN05444166_3658 [Singulisphaera sp. GP187]|uniref:hypothetical protein n=1 Tax=Singulisphaera sp. GP187 TaxID=1882752 RepID=UPI00092CC80E|nr:hypothetical protein [Singulisphaera sp. GP187]SIO30771.1 hypothetical protein SAMN05444166_3658 [Singulisphaera sp. GP187]